MSGRYARNPDFIFRKIADEMILVPVRATGKGMGSVYTLNEVGAFIWNLLDGTLTTEEVQDRVVEAFEVERGVAEADVGAFVEQLATVKAILSADGTAREA